MGNLRPLSGMLQSSRNEIDSLRRRASAATPAGEQVQLLPSGYPVDRTVCPDCRNDQRIVADCVTCRGSGMVCLNGPTARKGAVGDKVIVFCYEGFTEEEMKSFKPIIVKVDDKNRITKQSPLNPPFNKGGHRGISME